MVAIEYAVYSRTGRTCRVRFLSISTPPRHPSVLESEGRSPQHRPSIADGSGGIAARVQSCAPALIEQIARRCSATWACQNEVDVREHLADALPVIESDTRP